MPPATAAGLARDHNSTARGRDVDRLDRPDQDRVRWMSGSGNCSRAHLVRLQQPAGHPDGTEFKYLIFEPEMSGHS